MLVLITGAGRGIGRAVALAYAKEGAFLALCAGTESELTETIESAKVLGAVAIGRTAAISQTKDIEALVSEAASHFDRIAVLIKQRQRVRTRV